MEHPFKHHIFSRIHFPLVSSSKTLFVLIGPTAVGKTACALQVARHYACPILNADSRQIYRDIPIGTAAPTEEERALVPHHFVGILGLEDYYSAARYEEEAIVLLERVFRDHDFCVLSGGSMMYIDAVCHGIDDIPTVDEETRSLLRRRFETEGLAPLLEELRLLDPQYYAECDLRNGKRVVHALEICYMTGKPFSAFRTGQRRERPFRVVKICLQRERAELFERIGRRVDAMIESGMLEEARRVMPFRDCNSLNTVGYKELFRHLDGDWTLDFALEKIKRNTRVYAKKQMTWFKKDPEVIHLSPEEVADFLFKHYPCERNE